MKKSIRIISIILTVMIVFGCISISGLMSFAEDLARAPGWKKTASFYLLNEGLNIPTGTASQPTQNYKYVGEGYLKYYKETYNNGESVDYAIKQAPVVTGLQEGQQVLWYVVKEEYEGWHVDGVIIPFYSVLYDANSSDSTGMTTDPTHYFKDNTITIKENAFNRAGYIFKGWNTSTDGMGVSYVPGDQIKASTLSFDKSINIITLYAQWEKIPDVPVGEMIAVSVVTPKKMSIRLEDGTILKTGDTFTVAIGQTVRFQMCSNNWDNDTYDDNGNGIAGTVVYSFRIADNYWERSYDAEAHAFVSPKGDPVLRTDTNKCFMAYRYYFTKGDYNKQTGIKQVVNTPLEALSVNLPLGSTITSDAYKSYKWLDTANVFIETAADKSVSYTDYYWNY